MPQPIESVLTRAQKAGVVMKLADDLYVLAWRLRVKLRPFLGISDVRLIGDEWNTCEEPDNAWPLDAMAQVAAAIYDIEADRPAPPLSEPHAEIVKREEDASPNQTRVIAIDKKSLLVVYPFIYVDEPSVMIRNYEYKRGWDYTCYDIVPMRAALQIADYVTNGAKNSRSVVGS